jgi:hypothetical protein
LSLANKNIILIEKQKDAKSCNNYSIAIREAGRTQYREKVVALEITRA